MKPTSDEDPISIMKVNEKLNPFFIYISKTHEIIFFEKLAEARNHCVINHCLLPYSIVQNTPL